MVAGNQDPNSISVPFRAEGKRQNGSYWYLARVGLGILRCSGVTADAKLYLDPESMQNNGLYGCYYGFRAVILHAFGV